MGTIKFYNIQSGLEIADEKLEVTKSAGKILQMYWSKDGSIMTVTSINGYFFGFLTIVPSLCASCDIYAALLSSLTEISVVDCSRNNMIVAKTQLEVEPSFLNLGPAHFAVGINNAIWYFKWRQAGIEPGKMQNV